MTVLRRRPQISHAGFPAESTRAMGQAETSKAPTHSSMHSHVALLQHTFSLYNAVCHCDAGRSSPAAAAAGCGRVTSAAAAATLSTSAIASLRVLDECCRLVVSLGCEDAASVMAGCANALCRCKKKKGRRSHTCLYQPFFSFDQVQSQATLNSSNCFKTRLMHVI